MDVAQIQICGLNHLKRIPLFHFFLCALTALGVGLASCAPATGNPIDLATALAKPTEVAATVATAVPSKTPIPATSIPELTAKPKADYPIFDKAEALLTPNQLPVLDVETNGDIDREKMKTVVDGLTAMYVAGRIPNISPNAISLRMTKGNPSFERNHWGTPVTIRMTQDEQMRHQSDPSYRFVLFQTELMGEKNVLVFTFWNNPDGSVAVMSGRIPFSYLSIDGIPNSYIEAFANGSPTLPYVFQDEPTCNSTGILSLEYCNWHMAVQEEWLNRFYRWIEPGNTDPLSKDIIYYPLLLYAGAYTIFE